MIDQPNHCEARRGGCGLFFARKRLIGRLLLMYGET